MKPAASTLEIYLRTFEDFGDADIKESTLLYGKLYVNGKDTFENGEKMFAAVKVGKEVEDTYNHIDKNTDYRRFIGCKIGVCETEEEARQGSFTVSLEDLWPIWIYH